MSPTAPAAGPVFRSRRARGIRLVRGDSTLPWKFSGARAAPPGPNLRRGRRIIGDAMLNLKLPAGRSHCTAARPSLGSVSRPGTPVTAPTHLRLGPGHSPRGLPPARPWHPDRAAAAATVPLGLTRSPPPPRRPGRASGRSGSDSKLNPWPLARAACHCQPESRPTVAVRPGPVSRPARAARIACRQLRLGARSLVQLPCHGRSPSHKSRVTAAGHRTHTPPPGPVCDSKVISRALLEM